MRCGKKPLRLEIVYVFILLWSSLFFAGACKEDDPEVIPPDDNDDVKVFSPVAVTKTNNTKVYVHYMPWFETKETSSNGSWGMHWTMTNCNPEITDEDGKRKIASHYYPLIGPYASSDPAVIEYHLLLMKYAGIDGVIIDWYGSFDVNDYDENRLNAEALISKLDEVGLGFAITYEDRTTEAVVSAGAATTKIEAAQTDMQYIESNYFTNPAYIKVNNQPLLLVFGPTQIQTGADWTSVFNYISDTPTFLTLWYESGEAGENAAGEYSWVYQNNSHIDNFYLNQYNKFSVAMGSAYPGFKDYYSEGGWSTSIDWEIDHAKGETYNQTLQMAATKGVDYLQLVTWNDFGEGTMIEPTQEFQYLFLEETQEFSGANYSKTELEEIYNMYNLRKKYSTDEAVMKVLDQTFYYLVSLQFEKAKVKIDSLSAL